MWSFKPKRHPRERLGGPVPKLNIPSVRRDRPTGIQFALRTAASARRQHTRPRVGLLQLRFAEFGKIAQLDSIKTRCSLRFTLALPFFGP